MITYYEANQVRLALKMKLSRYCWYLGCRVDTNNDVYMIIVDVNRINTIVKKQIPLLINGIKIKIDLEKSK
jgi:hypothetical protein